MPHIGWAAVSWEHDSPLVEGIGDPEPFYFVHSFVPRPSEPATSSGGPSTASASPRVVERPPVWGAQFHPEKSSAAGLRMLTNFTAICAPQDVAAASLQ